MAFQVAQVGSEAASKNAIMASKKVAIAVASFVCVVAGVGTVASRIPAQSTESSASWFESVKDVGRFLVLLARGGRYVCAANACINNLRQLDGAKQQWGLEYKKSTNDIPTWDDIRPYIRQTPSGQMPPCTSTGTYTLGRLDEPPRCSVMEHNMGFGSVTIVDQAGQPVIDAQVAVRRREAMICSACTSTNGEAHLFDHPGSWETTRGTNSWSDGTKQIVAVKKGYDTEHVSLPTIYWPLRIVLKESP